MRFKILHTNDIHSNFENFAKITTKIKELKDENTLILDAGDFHDFKDIMLQGTAGAAGGKLLEEAGYDAIAIGNNEGFEGMNRIEIMTKNKNIPFLSCNIVKLDGHKIEGVKKSIIIGAVYSIIALMITVLFGSKITLLFVDKGEVDIISKATQYLITLVIFYIPLSLVYIVRFTIQGMGYSTLAILAGVCEMAARTLFGFVLVPVLGFSAACFASPIAWICADVFLIPAYKMVYKKLSIKLKPDKVEVVKKRRNFESQYNN